jgi:hypothetical protein
LTRIESSAFSSSSLKSIELPRNVEILGSSCFYRCESLSSISFESYFHQVISFPFDHLCSRHSSAHGYIWTGLQQNSDQWICRIEWETAADPSGFECALQSPEQSELINSDVFGGTWFNLWVRILID